MTGPRGSFPLGISATSGPKPQVKAVEIICELEGGGTQTFTLTGPTEGHVEVMGSVKGNGSAIGFAFDNVAAFSMVRHP